MIIRWLRNLDIFVLQVAESNSQSQKLVQYLNQLEKRIDAVNHPNMDKEVRGRSLKLYFKTSNSNN